jgi:lysophospholipase L1-like esterase
MVVVTLGDSVPAGTACDCSPFPDQYAKLLSPGARSINDAVAGYTSADVRSQIADPAVRSALAGASVVLIMAGANDLAGDFDGQEEDGTYKQDATSVEQNVTAMVAAIRHDAAAPVTVVVLGYWNVVKDGEVGLETYGKTGEQAADEATQYANDALQRAAADSGARFLPTQNIFGDDPTALLADDGDHPNAQGHQAIAEALYSAVPRVPLPSR